VCTGAVHFTEGPSGETLSSGNTAAESLIGVSIRRAAGLLPMQGTLVNFAFVNPLEGFQDLPFEAGLMKGARLFGCRPFLPKDDYREKLASGRISLEDIKSILSDELGAAAGTLIAPTGTRFDLRLAMLQYPIRSAPVEELRWFIAEAESLTRFSEETSIAHRTRCVEAVRRWVMRDAAGARNASTRDPVPVGPFAGCPFLPELLPRFDVAAIESWNDQTWEAFSLQVLWHVCRDGVERVEVPGARVDAVARHRDLLFEATGEDIDLLVHPVLIPFCAAFTDQGVATWGLPDRDMGFFHAFCSLYQSSVSLSKRWMRSLKQVLRQIEKAKQSPTGSILESLEELEVPQHQWAEYLELTVHSLRGWAGMIWHMEVNQDRVASPVPAGSLIEFVAVKLLLERVAVSDLVAKSGSADKRSLPSLQADRRNRQVAQASGAVEQRTFYIFQLAQVMGWNPRDLNELTNHGWASLIGEIESFPSLERRRIFQRAFEHHFLVETLDAIAVRNQSPRTSSATPDFQAVFCLDAREESLRRHLEEQSTRFQTYGAAGFFGVAMYFRGIADALFSAQCPVVIQPGHWVVEDPAYPFEQTNQFRARFRRTLGIAAHQIHLDSRSFAPGTILAAGLGTLASIPLVMRVLFPKLTARIRQTVGCIMSPPAMTRLRLERILPVAGPNPGEVGFTVEEMSLLCERLLRDIGLTADFARLVFFIGHGSACQNNPHKSTYDCGACTGSPGGPNGRAIAAMLNSSKVRAILATRGIPIPDDTIFVGGLHNTCDDTIEFYDLDTLPKSHFGAFTVARRAFELASRSNAHERCRRFYSAPLDLTLDEALSHVKNRSEDLAQTRPEFGNATNAICIVGRRSRTQGLFLDRRSFLQSYDPTQDDADTTILARILSAVIPVCSGINMQYNLSATDSTAWGCGTKLPHNITSLVGVMDGASSDLRCGLPVQGVEIHEPMRLLFVIETSPEAMVRIMHKIPAIGRILINGWAQLAVLDPGSNRLQIYRDNMFRPFTPTATQLPVATSSAEWYRGIRTHLPFALVESDR
jgi:uncharacterized protein YbcC (UPF0753/DUF2309 family)